MNVDDILKTLNVTFQGGANQESLQIKLFTDAIQSLNAPEVVMIELGSNDAFYSILFNKFFHDTPKKNICVEVSNNLLELGKSNSEKNGCENIHFHYGLIGELNTPYFNHVRLQQPKLWGELSNIRTTVSELLQLYSIDKVDILHMDIQGSEIYVVEEIQKFNLPVDYMFISTHHDNCFCHTHTKCVDILNQIGVEYIFSDEKRGGCGDGLIVCRRK